jgi:hypothetical protein
MPMPKSQLNSGSDLDEGCDLQQASAGEDGAAEETEANEPIGEAINVGEKFGEIGAQVAGIAARAGAALMESDKKRGSRDAIPQAEGGLGLERNLRGMSVKGEQEKARKIGKFHQPTKFTEIKH